MALIETRQLTKRFRIPVKSPGAVGAVKHLFRPRYEDKIAVNNINITIEAGESVAYVGPNGAGKSTTLKMLTGVLVPSSGEVYVKGIVPYLQRIENARNIGVVFGQRTQLWWDIPVQESLRLLGDIYEVPQKVFEQNFLEYIELLELTPLLRVPARQLSLGQRMRCDLIASLLHSPSILYLDEPTIGLDVMIKSRIRQLIKQINQDRGVTILLTSHDLSDIENLCSRIIIVDQGQIAFDGSLKSIKERFGREHIIHIVLHEEYTQAVEQTCQALLDLTPKCCVQQLDSYRLSVKFDATRLTAATIIGRILPLLPIHDLQLTEPTIESIIHQIYEGNLHLQGTE